MLTTAHKRTLQAVQAIIYILWPCTAFAAQVTLATSVASVPGLAWAMVFILSTVASLAALLNRLKESTPPRLGAFVASHLLGSWLAGVLLFFAGEAFDLHDFFEVGLIALGSYAGAQLMDKWAQAFTNRIVSETEKGSYAPKASQEQKQ